MSLNHFVDIQEPVVVVQGRFQPGFSGTNTIQSIFFALLLYIHLYEVIVNVIIDVKNILFSDIFEDKVLKT